jgi:hypothetical protein
MDHLKPYLTLIEAVDAGHETLDVLTAIHTVNHLLSERVLVMVVNGEVSR